ncbi:La-like protein [Lachnellula hyalina]|uniref:La-like protein n=1 Tax=Lachnellula hyalina TaxID=1316788 RepID=A0A8H8QYV0_9HELO|nr:La-like protein [Lachnellula hyalina]TVY25363.1 La-like protein [Lachnellula hyalina]
MSNIKAEATEPDPASTSISNDETLNKTEGDPSAPTDTDSVMAEASSEKQDGVAEAKKEETEDVNMEKNGEAITAKEKNGDSKQESSEKDNSKINGDYGNREHKPWVKHENRSKYDPSVLPDSDDPKEIRAQVEFYFGDSNLPTDANLWKETDGSNNKAVLITEIHKYKRMHRFQPYETVVAALRESLFLDVVDGETEGLERVKRKEAYDPHLPRSKLDARSIYAKGFGEEEPSSQFDIEAFFARFGTTNAVRLRRTEDRTFKGSVFVEFVDVETAEAFLKLDPKPKWKETELEITSKAAYKAKKDAEIRAGITKPKESWGPRGNGGFRGRGGRGGGRGRGNYERGGRDDHRGRGDRDPDDWKKRREDDRASGFKDQRGNRKNHDHKGGRGGRGGRRDDNRGPRNHDQKRRGDADTENNNGDASASKKADDKPKSEDSAAAAPATEKKEKRAREDDGEIAGGPAKKVDNKSEVKAEAS